MKIRSHTHLFEILGVLLVLAALGLLGWMAAELTDEDYVGAMIATAGAFAALKAASELLRTVGYLLRGER